MAKVVFLFLALGIFSLAECRNMKYSKRKSAFLPEEEERRVVCIEDMGCFDTGVNDSDDWEKWDATFQKSSRKDIGTQFRWWAPGFTKAQIITNFDFNEKFGEGFNEKFGEMFDAKLKVKFIIHGFKAGDAPWALTVKDALMRKEKCNVFIVDWSNGANMDLFAYSYAVANTRVVGAEVGHFIIQLWQSLDVNLEDIHIIGHSLGAHISGFAGKWVKDRLSKTVGRITGLDPAGPSFSGQHPGERLDMGDASFVDVIHTDKYGLGSGDVIGHFDFFPNYGLSQPGCENSAYADACSHSRAIYLFIESIESETCQFLAELCISGSAYMARMCSSGLRVQMGYHADEYRQYVNATQHQSFYLITNGETPYCKGLQGLKEAKKKKGYRG